MISEPAPETTNPPTATTVILTELKRPPETRNEHQDCTPETSALIKDVIATPATLKDKGMEQTIQPTAYAVPVPQQATTYGAMGANCAAQQLLHHKTVDFVVHWV
ncbi:uncharacterized protein N7483_012066 [Penicillium malachiteum]|uniref:uncharacterized protein n=1 Tax=Penicillium malachiteum TaxID=1324776 RepID=UPI0025476C43|nr:uncharacterized protein N7483_012066 [Penicillium malachiteum]KAJ5714885.1 hypothetical protein N7483_012066 [Penicillium malachiteum]